MIELENIRKQEQKTNRRKMLYKMIQNYLWFKMIGSFEETTTNGKITIDMANDEQNQLSQKIWKLISISRLINPSRKREKEIVQDNALKLFKAPESPTAILLEEYWKIFQVRQLREEGKKLPPLISIG